jgi:hypothetical protein
MSSKVIESICTTTRTVKQERDRFIMEYNCDAVPPFFEGHPLFLEPESRSCHNGLSRVTFIKNSQKIGLTASRLEDLISIFLFFRDNELCPMSCEESNFVIQGGKVVMARPWSLKRAVSNIELANAQKDTAASFCAEGMPRKVLDLWMCFAEGISPDKLLRHPVFWKEERSKCFILDVADSRFDLVSEAPPPGFSRLTRLKPNARRLRELLPKLLPKPLSNWITTMEKSPKLCRILEKQKKRYEGQHFPYSGESTFDLNIFSSNIVSYVYNELFRFVTLLKTMKGAKRKTRRKAEKKISKPPVISSRLWMITSI